MANNPTIVLDNIFLSDNEPELQRNISEKWMEYIRIMEENRWTNSPLEQSLYE